MKLLNERKLPAFLLELVLILILSLGVELFGFNGHLLLLEDAHKGMFELQLADLNPSGLDLQADGSFLPNGDDLGFAIDDDLYIHKLKIYTNDGTPAMHMAISGQDRTYDMNHRVKPVTVVPVEQNARDVWFSLLPDTDVTSLSLGSIVIDNTVTMNWLRVFLMVSLGTMVLFFLVFRELALSKLHVSLLVLVLTLGINIALATPAWYGLDEHAHFVRPYQLAQGNLGFDHKAELQWIADMDDFFLQAGTAMSTHNNYDEYVLWLDRYNQTDYPLTKYYLTTAATYPFIPYFFAGLGILLARLAGLGFVYTFLAGRIFNVIGYGLICAAAVYMARMGKRLLFVMALVPYALFSAGVYTADTFTVAFAILAVAVYGNMLCSDDGSLDWKLPAVFGLCCGLLALCKLPYAAFCALMLSVPLKKCKSNKQALMYMAGVCAVTGVIALATLLFGADKGIIQWYKPGMSITGQVKWILTHPISYVQLIVLHITDNWANYLYGSTVLMGYAANMSGLWTGVLVALLAALALLDRDGEGNVVTLLPKLACVIVICGGWVLCLTALYVSFNIVGANYIGGAQGRYFYPLLLPLLLLLKNGKLALPMGERARNGLCCAVVTVTGIAAVVQIFAGYCM